MIDSDALKHRILDIIERSDTKLTPSVLENRLSSELLVSRKEIRKTLNDLIGAGELEYTYRFGTSYVEKSFHRAVRISSMVVVKPYNIHYTSQPSDIVIDIYPGVSFGSGEHPTTRLSVRGIEFALKEKKLIRDFSGSTIFDIGTGSGILAIAALKLGIANGVGTDTEPCSLSEAQKNSEINGLAHRLRIVNASQSIDAAFSMVTANLRFPDIMNLFPVIANRAKPGAPVVLSGIRPEETDAVINRYTADHFKCLRKSEEKNWSCLVLQKNLS